MIMCDVLTYACLQGVFQKVPFCNALIVSVLCRLCLAVLQAVCHCLAAACRQARDLGWGIN